MIVFYIEDESTPANSKNKIDMGSCLNKWWLQLTLGRYNQCCEIDLGYFV